MGCIHTLIWKSTKLQCECPTHVPLKSLSVPPAHRTPLDRLGFPQRCCCCSLRVASVFICLLSFIWSAVELNSAEKFMERVFPERGDDFKYCKLAYHVVCVCFVFASALLMIGIIIKKELPIRIYIWYAFMFNCLTILASIGSTIAMGLHKGRVGSRQAVRVSMGMMWAMIFFYLLMVVNSYKLAVWYLTLGFGI